MNSKGALLTAEVEIKIPFHDCDPMQIVWHGNYARYLEVARCELLEKFDYDYLAMDASGYLWPIVDLRMKYIGSAVFSQTIKVNAYLKEYETRLKIDYVISDTKTGNKLTKATSVQVAVDKKTQEMQFNSPPVLLEKLARVL